MGVRGEEIKNDEETGEENILPILTKEVEMILKDLKNDRAPGQDKITNEILKIFKNELTPAIRDMLNLIMAKEIIPEQWRKVIVILLLKEGDKTDLGNYRPISLNSHMWKIFSKIIKNICRRLFIRLYYNSCPSPGNRNMFHVHR